MARPKKPAAVPKKQPLNEYVNKTYFDSAWRKERAARMRELRKGEHKWMAKGLLDPTRETVAIKTFANKFPDTRNGVFDMTKKIASFYTPEKNRDAWQKIYDKTTAHDVVTTKKIGTRFSKDGRPVWGCKVACDALAAALMARRGKIRDVSYVRSGYSYDGHSGVGHSYVKFRIGKKEYLANPFPGKPLIRELTDKDSITKGSTYSYYKDGENSRELNLSYKQFRA